MLPIFYSMIILIPPTTTSSNPLNQLYMLPVYPSDSPTLLLPIIILDSTSYMHLTITLYNNNNNQTLSYGVDYGKQPNISTIIRLIHSLNIRLCLMLDGNLMQPSTLFIQAWDQHQQFFPLHSTKIHKSVLLSVTPKFCIFVLFRGRS